MIASLGWHVYIVTRINIILFYKIQPGFPNAGLIRSRGVIYEILFR